MSEKSRLCVACGRFITGNIVQTDDGPVHDCGELNVALEQVHAEVERLKALLTHAPGDDREREQ